MKSQVDDLKVGMWVAVTKNYKYPERVEYNGCPMKIIAISLPFLCLSDGKDSLDTLDVRHIDLVRLNHRYVKAMLGVKKEKQIKKVICKRCHCDSFVQRSIGNGFQLVCRECGLNKGN
jgi:hypothetical protein